MPVLNLIISASCFLMLLISVHLVFAKQGNKILNRFLALLLFTRFGQIFIYLLVTNGQYEYQLIFQSIFTPFYFAAPACFYLYITGFIHDRITIRKTDWLHAIPFVLMILYVIVVNFSEKDSANQLLENKTNFNPYTDGAFSSYIYSVLRPLILFFYLIATWYALLTSQVLHESFNSIKKRWVLFCVIGASSFKLASFIVLITGGTMFPMANHSWFVVFNCLGLLAITVFVLHQPKLLYGYLFVSIDWKESITTKKKQEQSTTVVSKNNLLSDGLISIYTEAINELMITEKPYLQPDFQIIHLAQKLNIPAHHCSYVVNQVIGKNFRDWINSYRINYFINSYPLNSDRYTIEAFANQSGFKNVATFYNAFKKEKGVIPTAYFTKEILK